MNSKQIISFQRPGYRYSPGIPGKQLSSKQEFFPVHWTSGHIRRDLPSNRCNQRLFPVTKQFSNCQPAKKRGYPKTIVLHFPELVLKGPPEQSIGARIGLIPSLPTHNPQGIIPQPDPKKCASSNRGFSTFPLLQVIKMEIRLPKGSVRDIFQARIQAIFSCKL